MLKSKPFQPILLFAGGRSTPLSGAPEMDKHSSLFDTFISYTEKKFYNIGPNLTKEEEFSGQS